MAGVSVSHLVLFIASLVVAAGVAGTLVTEVGHVSESVTERSEGVSQNIETDVEMISDTGSDAIYNSTDTNITVLVKNTGSTGLVASSDQIDVLVDGRFIPEGNVSVKRADGSGETNWPTGSVVEIEINETLDTGDHRVTVTVNGNDAVLEFRV